MSGSAIVGTLRAILTLDTADFVSESAKVSQAAKGFARDFKSIGQQATALGTSLTKTLTLPLVGLGAGVAKLAMDFETSFAGVKKTVDATAPQFAALAQGFRDLSKEIPINVNELNKIGEAAGQLGIKRENILSFTKVMAELGVTTNLSSDAAASALARLANITGMPQTEFDRLGSTIVALGNNFATTEAEIVDFGLRVAGAGHVAHMSESDILAIGTAMSSVGVEAEAGGTAVQKVILSMVEATVQGGEKLQTFAATAGMSAAQFKTAFQQDAAGAFTEFVKGLGAQGQSAINTLDDLGLSDQRLVRSFLSLSGAGDLLTHALDVGTKAWSDNNALTEEARKRFETTESKLTLLWNRVQDVGITIGNALAPAITLAIQGINQLIPAIEWAGNLFAAMPDWLKLTAIGVAALVAAIGPLLFIFGTLAITASGLFQAFTTQGIAMKALTVLFGEGATAAGLFSTALTFLGQAAAVAGVAFAGWELGKWLGDVTGLTTGIQHLTERIFNLRDASEPLDSQQRVIAQALKLGAEQGITFADALKFLENRASLLRGSMAATATQVAATTKAHAGLTTATKATAKEIAAEKKQVVEANKAAEDFEKTLRQLNDASHRLGLITQDDVNEALGQMQLALTSVIHGGGDLKAALPAAITQLEDLAEKAQKAGLDTSYLNQMLTELIALAGIPIFPASIFLSGTEGLENLRKGTQFVTMETITAQTEAGRLQEAYDTLGVKTSESLHNAAERARDAYATILASGTATYDELEAARQRLYEAEVAAGEATTSLWRDTIKPAIEQAFAGISQSVSGGLVDMIGHWNRHAEILRDIWDGIKNTFKNILAQMLDDFINGFLKGMLSAIGAAKLGEALGNAILSGLGIGGSAAGGIGIGAGGAAGGAAGGGGAAGAGGVGGGLGAGMIFLGEALLPTIIGHLINQGPMYTPYLSPAQVVEAYQEYFGANYEQYLPDDMTHVTQDQVPWWTGSPAGSGAEPTQFGGGVAPSDVLSPYAGLGLGTAPNLARGGIIMPRSGGSLVNVAEAGVPEAVIPLDRGAPMQIVFQEDGRTRAEYLVRYIPGALQRMRLA